MAEEKDFRKKELLGKYMVKMLYSQDNEKFKNKYLRKLKRNWEKYKEKNKIIQGERTSFSKEETLKRDNVRIAKSKLYFILFSFLFLLSF